jgi:hypothetical protein
MGVSITELASMLLFSAHPYVFYFLLLLQIRSMLEKVGEIATVGALPLNMLLEAGLTLLISLLPVSGPCVLFVSGLLWLLMHHVRRQRKDTWPVKKVVWMYLVSLLPALRKWI